MSWKFLPFTDVVKDVTSGNIKIKSGDYLDEGVLPVIDQGKDFIGGYVNDDEAACKADLPAIIFGDHTKEIKFVNHPFALGADGVKVLKPQSKGLDEKFLYYFLKQSKLPEDAGYSRHYKFVKRLNIPLPPLKEQKRIAAILDKADALRRKRQQAIDLTDQLLRSVFLDMFGDPVTNPKGWDISPLKSVIVHANNGLSRRRKTSENIGDLVLRLQDVHYDGIRFEKDLNRIQLDDKEKQRYKLENSDILFIRVNGNPNYVGRSAVFHAHSEDVYHNDHLIRIKLSAEYDANFLCYLINYSGSRNIIYPQLKTSAGQHTISQGGIEKLEFYRPPIDLQNKFVEIVKNINETRTTFHEHEKEIGDLFSCLTQQAFQGELTKQTEAA